MALSYGFFNSLDGDRKYDAKQMAQIFDGILNDGVFQSIGEYFATKPGTGLQVKVGSGRAWFNSTWTLSDADIPLSLAVADVTLGRYDAVVLEVDHSQAVRANSIKVLTGTPGTNPVKPALTNSEDVHQHPLAYVYVGPGVTSITAANIQVVVGTSACPFVTGILETADIDALFAQWDGQFNTWFANVQAQLSGDIATNLQRQIDAINTNGVRYEKLSSEEYVTLKNASGQPLPMPEGWKVGDIRYSGRTDLGEKWALCNGADTAYDSLEATALNANKSVNIVEFGEPRLISLPDVTTNYSSNIIDTINVLNGKVFFFYQSTASSDPRIAIRDVGATNWSFSAMTFDGKAYPTGARETVIYQTELRAYRVEYAENQYVMWFPKDLAVSNGVASGEPADKTHKIYVSTDLIHWTSKMIRVTSTKKAASQPYYLRELLYGNGKWFAIYDDTGNNKPSYLIFAVSSSLDSAFSAILHNGSSKGYDHNLNSNVECFVSLSNVDGKFIVIVRQNSTSTGNNDGYIYDIATGTLSECLMFNKRTIVYSLSKIYKIKGYYVWFINGQLFRSSDLISSDNGGYANDSYFNLSSHTAEITEINDKLAVVWMYGTAFSMWYELNSTISESSRKDNNNMPWSGIDYYSHLNLGVLYDNGCYTFLKAIKNNKNADWQLCEVSTSGGDWVYTLPTITAPASGINAYIKVKEG